MLGIDDSAKDLGSSNSLIEKMSSNGIKNFITTPHILIDVYQNIPEITKNKPKAIKNDLLERNITNITIGDGAKNMIDVQFGNYRKRWRYSNVKRQYT